MAFGSAKDLFVIRASSYNCLLLTVVSRAGSKSPSPSRIARLSSSMSIGRCGRELGSSATAEPSLENSTLLDYRYCMLPTCRGTGKYTYSMLHATLYSLRIISKALKLFIKLETPGQYTFSIPSNHVHIYYSYFIYIFRKKWILIRVISEKSEKSACAQNK